MTRPRVHHIITRLIAGGAQENTILSCQGLQDTYDVTLVTGPPDGKEGSLLEDAARRGVRTIVIPELVRSVRPGTDARAFERLLRLFRQERPDIVHTHSSKAGILGRAAARCAGTRLILHTNHGLPFYAEQSPSVRATYWILERWATTFSDHVVCVGEEMRRKFLAARLGPPGLLSVIRSGIETEAFLKARSCRERLGIRGDARVVGMVSRMASHKGHRFLVEAAPREAHLLLVGDGEERTAIEQQVAGRGLEATFAGHVPPTDVPDLIASMDVLVHPSLWEGLPRVAVQALLVGRPVVAFDCDGAREVVIDGVTGRLVPPKSIERLRAAIDEVLARPDRGRSMGEEGRRRVQDNYDWRVSAAELRRLYAHLLGAKG